MIYIFDTSAFIVLKHYYRETFGTLWEGLDVLASTGEVRSVREVFRELENYNDAHFVQDWVKARKDIFATPSHEELLFVQEIFSNQRFRPLISAQAILKGTPVADPFVIAAAKVRGGAVVTQEQPKPNAAKIPNVCEYYKIPCMDLAGFMRERNWRF